LLPTASSKIQETTQDNNNIPSTTTHSQPRPHAEESSSGSSDEEDSVSGQEENESVGDAAEVNSRTIQLTEVERGTYVRRESSSPLHEKWRPIYCSRHLVTNAFGEETGEFLFCKAKGNHNCFHTMFLIPYFSSYFSHPIFLIPYFSNDSQIMGKHHRKSIF
jgi:hypothetical protein